MKILDQLKSVDPEKIPDKIYIGENENGKKCFIQITDKRKYLNSIIGGITRLDKEQTAYTAIFNQAKIDKAKRLIQETNKIPW